MAASARADGADDPTSVQLAVWAFSVPASVITAAVMQSNSTTMSCPQKGFGLRSQTFWTAFSGKTSFAPSLDSSEWASLGLHDRGYLPRPRRNAAPACFYYFNHRSMGLLTPFGRKGSSILRPCPAEAYPAYNASITTRPSSPVDCGFSLPRTQRAKCRISCGDP
jgi:hypothetical protein